jgi:general secretion pathway protein D
MKTTIATPTFWPVARASRPCVAWASPSTPLGTLSLSKGSPCRAALRAVQGRDAHATFRAILIFGSLALLAPGVRAQNAAAPAADAPAASARGANPAATLRFNFRGAPLETVLNYMSEAAGFIIVLETPIRGTVDMWSAQPVTREEAVQLLNFALNKNGYTASVKGRNLIVSSKEDAKKKNIPIRTGNDASEIPDNAEMVMQIIPLRRIDATQASRDLATLLPGSSTITANQDSNSLLVTDTNSNIKHVVELVNALDTSADTVSTMRVFKLKNADPVEMAQLLTNLYGTTSRGGTGGGFTPGGFGGGGLPPGLAALAAARGGGGGGGPGGGPGGFSGFGGGGTSGRSSRGGGTAASRATPVVAVSDARTASVIVTASKEAMNDIADIVEQLDANSARKQKVFVYTMENADVKQVETVLRNVFPSSNQRSTQSNQVDPLSQRAQSNTMINPNMPQAGQSTGTGR